MTEWVLTFSRVATGYGSKKILEDISVKDCVWELAVDKEEQVTQYMQTFKVSNVKQQASQYTLRIVHTDKPAPDAVPVVPTLEDAYLRHFGEGSHADTV